MDWGYSSVVKYMINLGINSRFNVENPKANLKRLKK